MSVEMLPYEPSRFRIIVDHHDDLTRITVPMQSLYVPVPTWISNLDLLALVVAPAWWITTLLLRTCLRLKDPPRAVFEINREHVTLALRSTHSGELTTYSWPRRAIIEARTNRYEPGLWLHVQGQLKETLLTDLPPERLSQLDEALQAALTR